MFLLHLPLVVLRIMGITGIAPVRKVNAHAVLLSQHLGSLYIPLLFRIFLLFLDTVYYLTYPHVWVYPHVNFERVFDV
nr:MAG TPA: hypothetical protein [Caudoviricetes sp.]